uniref:DUF834 domain-containing protein n=1 Tax=Oryza punctata TaxID=4537 RepID=A0A0E0M7K2_ORYPU
MEAAAAVSASPNLVEARSKHRRSGGGEGIRGEAANTGGWGMEAAEAGSSCQRLGSGGEGS